MRRLLVTAWCVVMLAGAAQADPTLWLADKADGDGIVEAGNGQTGFIDLWLSITDPGDAGKIMVGMDAILKGFDAEDGANLHFAVTGFEDQTPPGVLEQVSRGTSDVSGNINEYQLVLDDRQLPWGENSGWEMPGSGDFLLDRIQIQGQGWSDPPEDPDQVFFAFGAQTPGWTILEDVFGWTPNDADFAFGVGSPPPELNALLVTVPEPASLALLALAGLGIARRRRR